MINTQKLHTVQKKVEYILDRYTETRNSDIELYARYCENFYPPLERPIYNWREVATTMHSVTAFDHIGRCRRKAIKDSNYTKYLPTVKAIAIARGLNELVWNQYAKENNIFEPILSNIPQGFNDEGELITPEVRNGEYV